MEEWTTRPKAACWRTDTMTNCPNCGAVIEPAETRCPYCETPYTQRQLREAAKLFAGPMTAEMLANMVAAGTVTPNEARECLGLPRR